MRFALNQAHAPSRIDRLFWLNGRRWPVRLPIKWAIFGLTSLIVCFPYPRLFIRHLQHWSDPNALVEPSAPALAPLIEEVRPKIPDDLPPKQLMRVVEQYVNKKIEYDWDWNTWGMADYLPTVTEAVNLGREDCDGRAVVAASLLTHFGLEAELVTDFAHVWVKTAAGETMGPGKHKAVTATKEGLKVSPLALVELFKGIGLGVSVFPLPRELIIVMVLWLLMLRRNCGKTCGIVILALLVGGLLVLRQGGTVYLKPVVWQQIAGIVLMLIGIACAFFWAGRNARRAGAEYAVGDSTIV